MVENTETQQLSSSLRIRSAEESLVHASAIARSRGVSRVVDTTWLDKIGIPVYASIRPDAPQGSLCVHAGKGFTHAEAKIGAYMEAIEFSFAAAGRSKVGWHCSSPAQILKSFNNDIHFSDFCAIVGAEVAADDDMHVVVAEEIKGGLGEVLLPAELVFQPSVAGAPRIYGTTTNGLASGNSIGEATVHGLAEVMERHVTSFDTIHNRSVSVDAADAPQKIKWMMGKVADAGLTCMLRYTANDFGLPYFSAYILEADEYSPLAIAAGFGFHAVSEIAAVRAIAEAAQSRLTHIHGGRDDIIDRVKHVDGIGRDSEVDGLRVLRSIVQSRSDSIRFGDLPSFEQDSSSIESATQTLYEALDRADLRYVARVVFTDPDYPFQVVRIVVPGAEIYEPVLRRLGPRLLRYSQDA